VLFYQKNNKISKKNKKFIALNEFDDYYKKFGCKALYEGCQKKLLNKKGAFDVLYWVEES